MPGILSDLLGGGGGTEVNVTQTQQVSQNVNIGGQEIPISALLIGAAVIAAVMIVRR